jgi:anthranilate synthase component 1
MGMQGAVRTIAGERYTPFSLAKKLGAKVLLESASFIKGRERYSILLLKEAFSVYQEGDEIFLLRGGKSVKLASKARDILDILLYFANQHQGKDFPFPFPAGGIGYLSYEYSRRFDTIRLPEKNKPLGMPDADHYTDTISIIGLNYKEHEIDLERAISKVEERIGDLDFNYMASGEERFSAKLVSADERGPYEAGVEAVRREIVAGNLLQGVLSRRISVETEIPALSAYRNLRTVNPSPYMFYLDFTDFQLLGASPEVHVKVKGGRAVVRPIAGTRRRGRDDEEEAALEKELASDEKELAEHLMLVDLARNDLGRICRPASIAVTESRVIEKYSHVMHLVSQVEGELRQEHQGIDAIRATFPAGTVSGAPKIRAIEIIDSLEQRTREFYAGIVGYIEPGGSLDTCITIRSALKKDDALILQAGAGIVYDSIPEREYEETENKLRAITKAIGLEE